MFAPTNTFDHARHVAKLDGNRSCVRCHDREGEQKLLKTKPCAACHESETPMMARNEVVKKFTSGSAAGYKDAMHGMCIPCHRERAKDPELNRPDLGLCGTCHNMGTKSEGQYMTALAKGE
jgi:cytochrome c553